LERQLVLSIIQLKNINQLLVASALKMAQRRLQLAAVLALAGMALAQVGYGQQNSIQQDQITRTVTIEKVAYSCKWFPLHVLHHPTYHCFKPEAPVRSEFAPRTEVIRSTKCKNP
jgi:hypothetical protein